MMELIIVAWISFMWLILVLPGILKEKKDKSRKKNEYDELVEQMDDIKRRANEMEKRLGKRVLTRNEIKELEDLDEDRRSIMAKFHRIFKRDSQ